jgi:hypothetical protein
MGSLTVVAVSAAVAAGLTFGLGEVYLERVQSGPSVTVPVQEDQDGWDCTSAGNRICGPGNAQGAQPGCYSDLGELVAYWPCAVQVNPDGSSDVYVP